ncbi:hypothetical protein MKY30_11110 [Oceanobacillus sp. FSL W8-0428]|uniref:Uncharacterized protein n=1 Tax=Oceanobacillus sojae TaxID=582851 RepID=A0A511ZKH9_9BACI|nr:hypothetical protein [Oceanobacillus sojae]GEN87936.1 hypothetical protein OSO01_26750 [Oceanobacillus sojae]
MVEIVHDDIRPDGGNWEWIFDERSINPEQDFSQGYFLLDPGEEDEQVFYYFLVAHFSGEIVFEH